MSYRSPDSFARLEIQVWRLEQVGQGTNPAVHLAQALVQRSAGDRPASCDNWQVEMPTFVEDELNGQVSPTYRQMRQHLDLCPDCMAIYLDMLEVALLAERGPLPRPDLPVDLGFLMSRPAGED